MMVLFYRFVNSCHIYDAQEDEHYDFVCNSWLAEDIGENLLSKTFNVATQEEKRDLEYLFFNNVSLYVQHI